MSFPVSVDGTITLVEPPSDEEVLRVVERIKALLERARTSSISHSGSGVTFRGGLFRFVSNWNVLVPFGWGRIDVEAVQGALVIHYHLSTVQILLLMLALTAVNVVYSFGSPTSMFVSAAILICAFVGTYVIGQWRFRQWLIGNMITHRHASFPSP